jgi:L-methionine (R)-S-oxide reductase
VFELQAVSAADKTQAYAELALQAEALFKGEHDRVANAANLAALIWHSLPALNWAGFYFYDGHELVLGPFQGKPACIRIGLNQGVCGTAAATRQTQIVRNVHDFDGHIACDPESNAELVVPLIRDHQLIGVLDLDSPQIGRFDDDDRHGVEQLAALWVASLA